MYFDLFCCQDIKHVRIGGYTYELKKDRNKISATRETQSQAAWKKGWNEVADYIKSLKVFNGIKYYTF